MKHLLLFLILVCLFSCGWPRIHGPINNFEPETLLDTCTTKECLTQVLKTDPNNVTAHWRLGQKLQEEHNYPQAIMEFDATVKLDSTYNVGYPYRDRANCKNNLSNDSGAVNDMSCAIRQNPKERCFYRDRGVYLSNQQKYELALKDFDAALEIWNDYFEARVWKARTLVELKKYKEAMTEYNALNLSIEFINNPNNEFDIYNRGVAKFNTNDKEGACSDWLAIEKTSTDAKNEIVKHCK